MLKYEAIISNEKKDDNSFLVALIPAISIPQEYENEDEINITECAVIAANHGNNERNKWAYVHLEADEKETIGNALVAQCTKMNQWYWCNLYKHGFTDFEILSAELIALKEVTKGLRDGLRLICSGDHEDKPHSVAGHTLSMWKVELSRLAGEEE